MPSTWRQVNRLVSTFWELGKEYVVRSSEPFLVSLIGPWYGLLASIFTGCRRVTARMQPLCHMHGMEHVDRWNQILRQEEGLLLHPLLPIESHVFLLHRASLCIWSFVRHHILLLFRLVPCTKLQLLFRCWSAEPGSSV